MRINPLLTERPLEIDIVPDPRFLICGQRDSVELKCVVRGGKPGAQYEYEWRVGNWLVRQASPDPTWTFSTDDLSWGRYPIVVAVKSDGETVKTVRRTWFLKQLPLKLDVDPLSPERIGVIATFRVAPEAKPAAPLLYEWAVDDFPVTDWIDQNTFEWNTHGLRAGEHFVRVRARLSDGAVPVAEIQYPYRLATNPYNSIWE